MLLWPANLGTGNAGVEGVAFAIPTQGHNVERNGSNYS